MKIDTQPRAIYLSLSFRKPGLNIALLIDEFDGSVETDWLYSSADYFCISSEKAGLADVLSTHFTWLFNILEKNEQLLKKYRASSVEIDLSCYWLAASFNTCPDLELPVIKRLSYYDLAIWFDIYFLDGNA